MPVSRREALFWRELELAAEHMGLPGKAADTAGKRAKPAEA